MPKSLLDPQVLSESGGVTFLSGENVGLVPESLAGIVSRLAGPTRCRGSGVVFIAFARGREGLAGCRGSIEADGGRIVLADLESFGTRSAFRAFGRTLAGALARPGRFEEVPEVASPPGSGTGLHQLVSGLHEGGLGVFVRDRDQEVAAGRKRGGSDGP